MSKTDEQMIEELYAYFLNTTRTIDEANSLVQIAYKKSLESSYPVYNPKKVSLLADKDTDYTEESVSVKRKQFSDESVFGENQLFE